jgi:hypothetical protein
MMTMATPLRIPIENHLRRDGAPRDWRDQPVGGFAGPVAPDARIGTFADGSLVRADGAGTFAGSAAAQRMGSFADTRRDVPRVAPGDEPSASQERVAIAA